MNAKDIVAFAKNLKEYFGTNDPYAIAEFFGIAVLTRTVPVKLFSAQTVKLDGYPTIISINDRYTKNSQRLLCAHELGHALLHLEQVNYFATTSKNLHTTVEQEANLFALALLGDDDLNSTLTIPIEDMNNYMLKSIIDFNLKIRED